MYIVLLYHLAPKLRKWLMWNYICSLPSLIFILLLYEHIYEFMQAAADSQVDVIPHGGSGVYHLPWCNSASTAWTVQLSRPGQLAPLEAPLWTIAHSVGLNGRQRMSTLLYCLGEQKVQELEWMESLGITLNNQHHGVLGWWWCPKRIAEFTYVSTWNIAMRAY